MGLAAGAAEPVRAADVRIPDAYSAGIDPFLHDSFKTMRASCQARQWPAADARQAGQQWAGMVGGSQKFVHVVNNLGPMLGQ